MLLTGAYAYKIKKAVDFGFLDFTTLAARRFFCDEELRLNRRLAPELYLDVVPITGTVDAPVVGGPGPALEYAVKMREFPQKRWPAGCSGAASSEPADIDSLAARVAGFHGTIAVAAADGAFGASDEILRLAQRKLCEVLAPLLATSPERPSSRSSAPGPSASTPLAAALSFVVGSKASCANATAICISITSRASTARSSFSTASSSTKRCAAIDVMSEVAFTVMDLEDRGRADLAHRFLNAYLERTGDYAGLAVLPFYLAYRALVRAKIAGLRATQLGAGAAGSPALAESRGYLRLARRYAEPPRPALIITRGLSGCGKTAISQALLESDRRGTRAQRRRAQASSRGRCDRAIRRRHRRKDCIRRRRPRRRMIVCVCSRATSSARAVSRSSTRRFCGGRIAGRSGCWPGSLAVPFVIVALEAKEATLRERIARRRADGVDASDADLAVLAHQIATREPLTVAERAYAVTYDAEAPLEAAWTPSAWAGIAARLAGRPGSSFPMPTFDDAGSPPLMPVKVPAGPAH